jgi:alpha-glucosidase
MNFRGVILGLLGLMMVAFGAEASGKSDNNLKIEIINGERWWGLAVDDGRIALPFDGGFVASTSEFAAGSFRANYLISNRGRFLHSRQPMTVSYDGSRLVVTPAKGEELVLEKAGRTLRESYIMNHHKYLADSVKTVSSMHLFTAPIYELGGDDALLYTQQDVLDFAARIEAEGMPKGAILLPLGWHTPSGTLAFDAMAYPDPEKMIRELHDRGMTVMLTISPYIMAAGRNYQRCRKEGRLLTNAKGEPIVFQSRLGYTACRSLCSECVEEMNGSLKRLQKEYGVDGFYFDLLDAASLLGDDREKVEEYIRAWHSVSEGVEEVIYSSPLGSPDNLLCCSVSTTRNYSWQELQGSVERTINASLLGYPRTLFAAGIEFGGDSELILRTAQCAALMPIAIVPYTVWSLEDLSPIKSVLLWRQENKEYIADLVAQSASTAEPIVRHLEYEFPRMGFTNCDDEYMFGSEWLVAPPVGKGVIRMVRLPKGSWREWGSDRVYRGPRVVDLEVADGRVAIFHRE